MERRQLASLGADPSPIVSDVVRGRDCSPDSSDPMPSSKRKHHHGSKPSDGSDASVGLPKSAINNFFDLAAPHLIGRFTAPPIPDLDVSAEQFRVQEQSRDVELVLGQLSDDMRNLETAFPVVQREVATIEAQAGAAKGQAEAIQGFVTRVDRLCDRTQRENASRGLLLFQIIVTVLTWLVYCLALAKRFISSPVAFVRNKRKKAAK
jgi:hypothetical protein